MQTYLKNGYIVSMDQQDTVFDGGGVLQRSLTCRASMYCPGL